ncbi:unnamed protein product [Toxocara canis]|uniref:Arrestin_C domain-containing protein n=1 Tax=Toxocara canis TaxID=6265 RepID=A0A183UQS4_TOXCA|nr:unnamed protein product [Toxocara canis]
MDNHFGVFVPGNRVSGVVQLTLSVPIRANELRIGVYGKARTSWMVMQNSLTQYISEQGVGCDMIPYESEEVYLCGETELWASANNADEELPSGTHTFPFSFDLPLHCPPSFEGTAGYVRYYCKALLDRPWKFDQTTKCVFTVIPTVDLNQLPTVSLPIEVRQCGQVGLSCIKQRRIDLRMSISKSGHVPGEFIMVTLRIFNGSSNTIRRLDVRLLENASYTACMKRGYIHPETAPFRQTIERRYHTRILCHLTQDLSIKRGCSSAYMKSIRIPPTAPTFNNCPIIQVEYFLQAQITVKGDQLPTYEDCVFGKGTMRDEEDNNDFAPKYVFYDNMKVQ